VRGWFRRSRPAPDGELADAFSLEAPLLHLSPADVWTVGDACQGTQIFGATGSGKTSGSGQAIAKAFLRAGFGGLVLTAKPDECKLWQRYAAETGRTEALMRFSLAEPWRFNFLDYEARRPGRGGGLTENLAALFSSVLEVAERRSGHSSADYWQRATRQLLRNAIDLCLLAAPSLTLFDLYRVITSAPHDTEQRDSPSWREASLCFRYLTEADARELSESQRSDFDLVARYWLEEFPTLAEKTRSVIVSGFTSMADGFLRGPMRELFCTSLSILPEMTHEGAVIVLDLPLKEFGEVGILAQVIFKLLWQQATERRDVARHPRPVFLWADEAHFFLHTYDALFQTTARSARACTVYLTQNLPNYLAALGGERGRDQAHALLGNLQTKFFHANADPETNRWAADLFGQTWQHRSSSSATRQPRGMTPAQERYSTTAGSAEQLAYEVLPHAFTVLATGGSASGFIVEAIAAQGGRSWRAGGRNHLRVRFSQKDT
jgi:type IV secretory pathway TraG/TraD family ATPase VirD4